MGLVACRMVLFLEEPKFSRPGTGLSGRLTPSRAEAYCHAMGADLMGLAATWRRQSPGREVALELPGGTSMDPLRRTANRLGLSCVPETEQSEAEVLRSYANEVRTGTGRMLLVRARAPDLPIELFDSMLEAEADVSIIPSTDGGWHALYAPLPQAGLFEGVNLGGPNEARDTAERAEELGLVVHPTRPWPVVHSLSDLEALWHRLDANPTRAPRCHELLVDW